MRIYNGQQTKMKKWTNHPKKKPPTKMMKTLSKELMTQPQAPDQIKVQV